MKKIIYILVLLPMLVIGQTNTQNYTKVTTYKDSLATNPAIQVTYFDGLGRPVQQIANTQSNSGKNIVTHIEYDAFGRQPKEYLPYKSDAVTLDFVADPLSALLPYYSSPSSSVNGNPNQEATNNPFSEKEMEFSPLNRVLKQAAPGDSWALGSGHEIKMEYQANDSLEVKYFKATTSTSLNTGTLSYDISITDNGYYNKNELYKTVTKDENWTSGDDHTTQEFKNKEGQVVLKRTFNGEAYDTFYVYDQYGNLTYVLPPLAEASITQAVLDGLCYQYKYDSRNRLVAKKLPGKQWEFIVYDTQDRPVATGPAFSPWGDGTLGMMITEYDAFGRVTKTGWRVLSVSESARGGWQGNVNGGSNPFVLGTNDVLTKNYYDNYTYPNAPTPGSNFATAVKGLATGSWVRILTTPTELFAEESYTLYDAKYRPTRSYTKNYLGGYTQVDTKLDFMGKTLRTITRHKRTAGDTEMVVTDTFTYTAQDRLALHKQQVDSMPEELIASNTYDELGQLVSKKVGGTVVDGTAGLQKVDYAYNIRGWLKNINDVSNLSATDPSQLGSDPMDLFAFKLSYQDNDVTTGGASPTVLPLYNGNISESFWRTANDDVQRKYAYSYDPLNRLLNAAYSKPESAIYTNSYMEDISYDKNGNIQTLNRYGGVEDENYEYEIDALEYKYTHDTNRLMRVFDNSRSPQGFSETKDAIVKAGDLVDDYAYDTNGNMTKDDNKGITLIAYNHLNLPTKIIFNTTNTKIEYLYDALGQKKAKNVTYMKAVISGGEESKAAESSLTNSITYVLTTDQTDYLAGGFQYKNTVLQFFPHAEGYVNHNTDDTFTYVFNYTDHLGNSRLSYSDGDGDGYPEIVEENNYYPFGLKQEGYNGPAMVYNVDGDGSSNSVPYKYKYNGKELQDELGLNKTAMDFRQYDSAIGRFDSIDALAELCYSVTPNHFGYNSPNYWADPSGLISQEAIDAMWNNSANNASTTWTNGGGNNFDSSAGNGWVNADSGTFNENTASFTLPEVKVGSNSSNWTSKIEQHVYDNSPFYKHDDPYEPAGDANAAFGVAASGLENFSGITRVGTNATFYTPGAAGRVFYGNQHVSTFGLSKIGTVLGKASFAAGVIMDAAGVYNYYQNPASSHTVSPAKMGLNTTMGYIGLKGPPPLVILSAIYFLGDAFIPGTTQEPGGGWPTAIEAGTRNSEGNRAILGSDWSLRPCGGL